MSASRPVVVVVGDALLDRDVEGTVDRVCPDAPVPVLDVLTERCRPGGAALAAALLAADGVATVLVTALADDGPGRELAALLDAAGVTVHDLGLHGRTPEKVRVRAGGQSLVRLDRALEPGPVGPLPPRAAAALAAADAVLVSDYGRGVAAEPSVRHAVAAVAPSVPVVWDPHPKGPAPVPGVMLVTPNADEVARLVPEVHGGALAVASVRGASLAATWAVRAVAVTLGSAGAVLVGAGGPPLAVPAEPVDGGDPCGAGDRFAAAAAAALAGGAIVSEAVEAAVGAATAYVAAGGASAVNGADLRTGRRRSAGRRPTATTAEAAVELSAKVRSEGGTVVATGGCFDLLHAGHVGMLQAARGLGDCLVVCLNSDASVARLKGPDRPLQPQADRVAVLAALDCVDAVVVFDGDTPIETLRILQPHLFCKGADYGIGDLPEAAVLTEWGGRAVLLPYLPGRSTTRLVQEVARRGA